jgi:transposase
MRKISTVRVNESVISKGSKLTIGLDLGDRFSCYCVLDEAGEVILEQKLATTREAMEQAFSMRRPKWTSCQKLSHETQRPDS